MFTSETLAKKKKLGERTEKKRGTRHVEVQKDMYKETVGKKTMEREGNRRKMKEEEKSTRPETNDTETGMHALQRFSHTCITGFYQLIIERFFFEILIEFEKKSKNNGKREIGRKRKTICDMVCLEL